MADFKYTGSQAYNIYNSMLTNSEEAKTAYDAAVTDFEHIKEHLSVNGSDQKFANIVEFHSDEIGKVIKNIEEMMQSVQNVDSSWQGVASEINEAIDTYMKSSDGE